MYAENTVPNPSGGGNDLDASVQIDSHFGMSARTAAKMVVTHAPSDISSIQGDLTDLTERDCQTPNSDISVEVPAEKTANVEMKPAQQVQRTQKTWIITIIFRMEILPVRQDLSSLETLKRQIC